MKHIFLIYHPAVIFAYLASALVCAMLTVQPGYVLVSLLTGCLYSVYLNGARSFFRKLRYMLILFFTVVLLNPLFQHTGLTVLFYLGDNPITLEALVYGLCAGGMLLSVMVWFTCYQVLMDQEKFLYLFGKGLPTAALMLSMILKWIPETRGKAERISRAQAVLQPAGETRRQKLSQAARTASVLMSWSMEDSIETADSMRARGYGITKRSSFSVYRFFRHDLISLVLLCLLFGGNLFCLLWQTRSFAIYPAITGAFSPVWAYAPYALMLLYPLLLEGKEKLVWNK